MSFENIKDQLKLVMKYFYLPSNAVMLTGSRNYLQWHYFYQKALVGTSLTFQQFVQGDAKFGAGLDSEDMKLVFELANTVGFFHLYEFLDDEIKDVFSKKGIVTYQAAMEFIADNFERITVEDAIHFMEKFNGDPADFEGQARFINTIEFKRLRELDDTTLSICATVNCKTKDFQSAFLEYLSNRSNPYGISNDEYASFAADYVPPRENIDVKKVQRCFHCHKPGHFANKCRKKIAEKKAKQAPKSKEIQTNDPESEENDEFKAINTEIQALIDNRSYTEMEWKDVPPFYYIVDSRIVLTKKDAGGYKARLITRGSSQVQGIEYFETFSPVISYDSIRIILYLASQYGLEIHQMDVATAFLNAELQEDVYMKPPKDYYENHSEKVWKLNKSLYGFIQAPLEWNKDIVEVLKNDGFKQNEAEMCLFFKGEGENMVIIGLYVDDLLIVAKSMLEIAHVKQVLAENFKMKDMGPVKKFLGINIDTKRENNVVSRISILLRDYIDKIIKDCGLGECLAATSPTTEGINWDITSDVCNPKETKLYRLIVSKLLFASNAVRCDIAFTVSLLSTVLKEPQTHHLKIAKGVVQYLSGSKNLELVYEGLKQCIDIKGYADSDWDGDKNLLSPDALSIDIRKQFGLENKIVKKKSCTGFIFTGSGTPLTWGSKQGTDFLCSCEAECMALLECDEEALWIKHVFKCMKIDLGTITIFEDNDGTKLTQHTDYKRPKHIDVRYHKIMESLLDKDIDIQGVPSQSNYADLLTKISSLQRFGELVKFMFETSA